MNEPHAIQILIHIAGAAALLIWAVRLVRTGVERGFAAPMRIWLRHSAKNRLLAAGTGMGAAVLLQSSTAVAVLVSNFVSKGGLATAVWIIFNRFFHFFHPNTTPSLDGIGLCGLNTFQRAFFVGKFCQLFINRKTGF